MASKVKKDKPIPQSQADQATTNHCVQVCDAKHAMTKLQKLWLLFTIVIGLVLLLYMLVCVCVHH